MPFNSGVFRISDVTAAVKNQTWSNRVPTSVDYIVVGGGGAGGDNTSPGWGNAGGGAGGFVAGNFVPSPGTAVTVTIGAGSGRFDATGGNTSLGGITAYGGGTGARAATALANSGGSGGGGAGLSTLGASTQFAANGLPGQGNPGGIGSYSTTQANGGGGGGASTPGRAGYPRIVAPGPTTLDVGGDGGQGIASSIAGNITAYAGGGGGATNGGGGSYHGLGGAGGGGNGGGSAGAGNGTANTGGAGGGAALYSNAATGGSGVVILSYPDIYAAPTSTTGSPTVSTSGSGSISFNGSTYLNYGDQTAFEFGSGDFTIEAWVYITSLASTNTIAAKYTGANISASEFLFYVTSAGALSLALDSSTPSTDETIVATATSAITTNQWTHVAATRSGSTVRLFVGGSVSQTATYTRTINATSVALTVGGITSGTLVGYMSNFRIVKGTAVYTGAFTPSTIPLTAISGTSLLLNSVSGSFLADSSGNAFSVSVPSGTATWNSASPFATGLGFKNRVYTFNSSGSITF